MFRIAILSALLGAWVLNVEALEIIQPTPGQNVSLADSFVIEWKMDSDDASAISIDLLNASSINKNPILENIAHNLNTTSGQVNVTWPLSVPNDTAAYNLYFIASASGDTIASSGIFNLTLPPGENRTQAEGTVGPYGTHPASDYPQAIKHSLSGGAIAGIVVGACAGGALCAFALIWYLRRQRRHRRQLLSTEHEKQDKPELDGTTDPSTFDHRRDKTMDTTTSTELDAYTEEEKRRIASQEMEGDMKDYLRYELPSTPPPPVELADNEIPAAEMPSPDPGRDEKGPARLGDWTLHEAPTPRRPESVLSGRTGHMSIRSGSTTLGGGREVSFAEALHDIVSQELRRKE